MVGVPVGHIEEFLHHPQWLPRHLLDKVGILDPFSEGCHDDCVADAGDGVLLLDEPPDEFPKGLIFLLCDLVKIPLNPRFCEHPLKVADESGTEIFPGID